MRLNITLTSFLLLFSLASGAQNLTGIWRGYFGSSSSMYKDDTRQEMYKYEVQIDQQSNNALKGVTYSYQSTVFYGKVFLGIKKYFFSDEKFRNLVCAHPSDP